MQGGGNTCCHSNHLTTEGGDIELSIQVLGKNDIRDPFNFVQYMCIQVGLDKWTLHLALVQFDKQEEATPTEGATPPHIE